MTKRSAVFFACNEGYYSTGGALSCTRCSPGTFTPTMASTSCSLCPAGFSSDLYNQARSCYPCEEGAYALAGMACTPCPAGTFTDVRNSSFCSVVPKGNFFLLYFWEEIISLSAYPFFARLCLRRHRLRFIFKLSVCSCKLSWRRYL